MSPTEAEFLSVQIIQVIVGVFQLQLHRTTSQIDLYDIFVVSQK